MGEFLKNLPEIFESLSHYSMPFTAICAYMAYMIKPVRCKIIKIIKKISRSDEISVHIEEINAKIDMLLEYDEEKEKQMNLHEQIHLSALKNRITNLYFKYINSDHLPAFEKQNLAEQYGLYKKIGGNGYLDVLYEVLIAKRTERK